MKSLLCEKPIYKVTYGMNYDAHNNLTYTELLSIPVGPSNNDYFSVPVYARIEHGKLIELVTGLEIPIALDPTIPGFGAYKISSLITKTDYQNFVYYITQITENHLEEYKNEFVSDIDYFYQIRQNYCSKAFDEFGSLETHNKNREKDILEEYNNNTEKAEELVKKLKSKYVTQLTMFDN